MTFKSAYKELQVDTKVNPAARPGWYYLWCLCGDSGRKHKQVPGKKKGEDVTGGSCNKCKKCKKFNPDEPQADREERIRNEAQQ